MSKDPLKDKDPLSYRVLLMMPAIYRLWSRVRLRDLGPWVDGWDRPEMFAGTTGKGACDAAYETSMMMELCKLEHIEYTGGSADILSALTKLSDHS